ncbi:MAG: hypothetical protein AAF628_14220 [Planctomycetota bacterium]
MSFARAAVAALAVAAAWTWWCRIDVSAAPEITRFRDDAYYYFAWARSVAAGDGPCVTAGQPTNGVHPLFGCLLALGALFFGSSALPPLAHALGLALHAATAGVIAVLLWPHRCAAAAAALLFLGLPAPLTEAQNGQETALAAFGCAVLLLAWSRAKGDRWFVIAAVGATLARSDLWLLVPWLALQRHGFRPRAVVAPGLALAAYVAVCWVLSGSPVQDSAAPIPWLFDQHFNNGDPSGMDRLRRLWWWLRPCLLDGPWHHIAPVLSAVVVWVAGGGAWRPVLRWSALPLVGLAVLSGASGLGVAALAAALVAALGQAPGDRGGPPARALLGGWLAIMVLHYAVRHYPRPYYFVPLAVPLCWIGGWLLQQRPRLGLGALLATAAWSAVTAPRPAEQRPWQEESIMAARFLPLLLPQAAPIGAFNAGILAWRYPGRVVNLDGVVNRPAFEALRAGRLDDYLDQEGVRFLVDAPVQFATRGGDQRVSHASGRFFGPDFDPALDLVELARFDVPGADAGRPATDSVRLYWRRGRGAPPVLPPQARPEGRPGSRVPRVLATVHEGRYVLWHGTEAGSVLRVTRDGGPSRELVRAPAPPVVQVVKVWTPQPGRYSLADDSGPLPILTFEQPPPP